MIYGRAILYRFRNDQILPNICTAEIAGLRKLKTT